MKAIIISESGGFDNLKFVEREIPPVREFEVRVHWKASSLNYHDLLVAKGIIPVSEGRIPMSDGAGIIVEVGKKVKGFKAGDKVMSLFFPNWVSGPPDRKKTTAISGESVDGYAVEYSNLPESSITHIPDDYTYAEAATLPCAALTAWRALVVEGKIEPGNKVLIEGTGGMSVFALQIARSFGAVVYATSSSKRKAEILKTMGAVAVVNYKEDPKWGKTIYKLSEGGVDHVLDVGGAATFSNSVDAVKIDGFIASIGILGGPKGEIVFPKLFFKQISVKGLAVGSAQMQRDMVQSINTHRWKPIIDKTFSFENLKSAFEYQESGKHFGKIIIEYD
ncbi:MAG: NAD(P)-dependent alcohol dehydrogenase [Bacteroidia bacterium]|nr:NAD(P)-dependent alcohol dehydrogenase [Bacteroidia bacterium]